MEVEAKEKLITTLRKSERFAKLSSLETMQASSLLLQFVKSIKLQFNETRYAYRPRGFKWDGLKELQFFSFNETSGIKNHLFDLVFTDCLISNVQHWLMFGFCLKINITVHYNGRIRQHAATAQQLVIKTAEYIGCTKNTIQGY